MKQSAIKHKTHELTEKETGAITNSAPSIYLGVAVCVYDCDHHVEKIIQSHEEGDTEMDRSMVAEFRKSGQVITCGQTVYSLAQKHHLVSQDVVENDGESMTSSRSNKHGTFNKNFLGSCDVKTMDEILGSIGKHYGISRERVMTEIYHADAEHLLDYLTGEIRTATHVLMKRRGVI
jgi:hypothetical protein